MDKEPPKTNYSFMGFILGGTLIALIFSDEFMSRSDEPILVVFLDYITLGNGLIDILRIPIWIVNFIFAVFSAIFAVIGGRIGNGSLLDGQRMSGRLIGAIVGSLILPLICIILFAIINLPYN